MRYLVGLVLGAIFVLQPYHFAMADYTSKVDVWMEKLAHCESGGNPDALNPDDGGSPSIGLYQFKTGTFATYLKKYSAFISNGSDIKSGDTQRQLARYMILTDYGWRHWRNCSLAIGLLPHMASL